MIQLNMFKHPPAPDYATVNITRHDNPESSKQAAAKHQKLSQKGKCRAMYDMVVLMPGLTFTEYWARFKPYFKEKKFSNVVDVSRQLFVLKKKGIIKRNDPGRECQITGRLCCTWEPLIQL